MKMRIITGYISGPKCIVKVKGTMWTGGEDCGPIVLAINANSDYLIGIVVIIEMNYLPILGMVLGC